MKRIASLVCLILLAACDQSKTYMMAPEAKSPTADAAVKVTIIDPLDNRVNLPGDSYNHNVIVVTGPVDFNLTQEMIRTRIDGNAILITQVRPYRIDIVDCGTPCNRSSWRIEIYYHVLGLRFDEPDRHSKVTVKLDGVPDQQAVFEVTGTNKG